MGSFNVWAYHKEVGPICSKGAIDDGGVVDYPDGPPNGQAGWHVGVMFQDLADLAAKLSRDLSVPPAACKKWFGSCDPIAVGRGEIERLAIMAHGDQGGQIAIAGRANPPYLNPGNVPSFHQALHTIGLSTRAGSTIILMGCLAGQGVEGTNLLGRLSRIWPGRRVVGFSTAGYRHPGAMKRSGESCMNPGMRDTDAQAYLFANPLKWDRSWSDLKKLPWASDVSPHAKVVIDGRVVRWPEGEARIDPDAIQGPAQPVRGHHRSHKHIKH